MIGEVVREKREAAGMSIAELSKRSGVSASKISEQERSVKDMSVDQLFKVDSALDHDIIWELATLYDER